MSKELDKILKHKADFDGCAIENKNRYSKIPLWILDRGISNTLHTYKTV